MKEFSFYRLADGIFTGSTFGSDLGNSDVLASALIVHTPEGCGAIEGRYDHLSQRMDIESGQIVDYQSTTTPSSTPHVWNADTQSWVFSNAEQMRQRRTNALAQITTLESKGLRAQRELALGYDGAKERLQDIDQQIAGLRAQLLALDP